MQTIPILYIKGPPPIKWLIRGPEEMPVITDALKLRF
jgi:hypothetical protein